MSHRSTDGALYREKKKPITTQKVACRVWRGDYAPEVLKDHSIFRGKKIS